MYSGLRAEGLVRARDEREHRAGLRMLLAVAVGNQGQRERRVRVSGWWDRWWLLCWLWVKML